MASSSTAAATTAAEKRRSSWGGRKWGDEDDSKPTEESQIISSTTDKNGIKTVIERRVNEKGEKVQTTRRYRVVTRKVKVNKAVQARRKYKKFGDCTGQPDGPEHLLTATAPEWLELRLVPVKKEEDKEEVKVLDKIQPTKCRTCGETGHWTLMCPQRKKLGMPELEKAPTDDDDNGGSSNSNKYVVAFKRPGAAGGGGGGDRGGSKTEDDACSVRVTNISEETTEQDLRTLFRNVGHPLRVYLAKDRFSHQSRGFAYITYATPKEAQKAIDTLDGHGYDNLILHVEVAKPREGDDRRGGDRGGGDDDYAPAGGGGARRAGGALNVSDMGERRERSVPWRS